MLETIFLSLAGVATVAAMFVLRALGKLSDNETKSDPVRLYDTYNRSRATFSPFGHSPLD